MSNKTLYLFIALAAFGMNSFAQQWTGTPDINGSTYRNGNVGIGTSSNYVPFKLTVVASAQNDGIWMGGTGSKDIALLHNVTGGSWNGLSQAGDHLLFWKTQSVDDANAGALVIGPWSNGFKGMRITSAGNVGIGTGETGSHRLNVAGSIGTNELWVAGSSITKSISLLNNVSGGAWNPLTQTGDNLILWKGTNPDQADAGALVIAPWSNANNGIRINPQGNVSIGTNNPGTFKLAVEGRIGARGIRVTMATPFPDYVFDSTYQLRPLFSLEQYINQNKHLPGIPSAAEVEKEGGVELGDMSVKLLEKIEELTLYVIEMKKENEQMKKEIKALKGNN
jgi:hypothetical protein